MDPHALHAQRTPLFVAAGMAKLRPWDVIPPFFVGKLVSDPIAVFMGKYARGSAVLIRASGVSAE